MAKSLTEMAAEIVAARINHSNMSDEEISEALHSTFNALSNLKNAEESDQLPQQESGDQDNISDKLKALREHPEKSIKKAKVICLECGQEFKLLTNGHLKIHNNMTTREYREKWGLKKRQPLSCHNLSLTRKNSAVERGLGEKLVKARKASLKKD